ncbi:MAG: hypothetical protein K8L97_19295 [Anaerolineae bacterium]|nr:hypothetical protein [Anaerolineae bacterium]
MAALIKNFNPAIPALVKLLVLALMGGGLIGAVVSFFLVPGGWPWSMPPLALRFLAGAATAYLVGSLLTITRPRWTEHEFLLSTVVLYGIPLGLAILFDNQLVDWSKPIAWAFLVIVAFALVVCFVYLWRNRNLAAAEKHQALDQPTRTFLLVVGILTVVVGGLVYIVPKQAGLVWPWATLDAWKPLDSRLIASMLLTIGGGAFLVWWRNDRGAMQVLFPMLWAYCIVAGIGLLMHAGVAPEFVTADLVYVGIFAVFTVISAALYFRNRN